MRRMWSRIERQYPVLLAFRRKVDAGIVGREKSSLSRARGPSPFPMLGALILLSAAAQIPGAVRWLLIAVSLPLVLLQCFNFWRGYRIDKAKRYWEGRDYERRVRYELAPEYHDSEDALLAAFRRKLARSQCGEIAR